MAMKREFYIKKGAMKVAPKGLPIVFYIDQASVSAQCFIGKAHLDRALEARLDHPFRIAWHPFQLNPDMPADGMDRRAYLEAKFGGKDNAVKIYARIAEAAEAAGEPVRRGPMESRSTCVRS